MLVKESLLFADNDSTDEVSTVNIREERRILEALNLQLKLQLLCMTFSWYMRIYIQVQK